jgi:SAM-dependent methyltransferase
MNLLGIPGRYVRAGDGQGATGLFDAFLNTYYFLPPLAFWRAIEARELGPDVLPEPSLDVGSSDGSFAATWLGDRPPLSVGLDINPVHTRWSDRAYREVVSADAQAMPFRSESFNSILCNSVIEHVPDDLQVVAELGRVLRPAGLLLLTTPSVYFHDYLHGVTAARSRGDEEAAGHYMSEVDQRLQHYHYRSLENWAQMLGGAGFSIVSHSYYLTARATAFWDRWDTWLTTRQWGRLRYQWLISRKLGYVIPRAVWRNLFRAIFRPAYQRAIAEQADCATGASLFIRAVRN